MTKHKTTHQIGFNILDDNEEVLAYVKHIDGLAEAKEHAASSSSDKQNAPRIHFCTTNKSSKEFFVKWYNLKECRDLLIRSRQDHSLVILEDATVQLNEEDKYSVGYSSLETIYESNAEKVQRMMNGFQAMSDLTRTGIAGVGKMHDFRGIEDSLLHAQQRVVGNFSRVTDMGFPRNLQRMLNGYSDISQKVFSPSVQHAMNSFPRIQEPKIMKLMHGVEQITKHMSYELKSPYMDAFRKMSENISLVAMPPQLKVMAQLNDSFSDTLNNSQISALKQASVGITEILGSQSLWAISKSITESLHSPQMRMLQNLRQEFSSKISFFQPTVDLFAQSVTNHIGQLGTILSNVNNNAEKIISIAGSIQASSDMVGTLTLDRSWNLDSDDAETKIRLQFADDLLTKLSSGKGFQDLLNSIKSVAERGKIEKLALILALVMAIFTIATWVDGKMQSRISATQNEKIIEQNNKKNELNSVTNVLLGNLVEKQKENEINDELRQQEVLDTIQDLSSTRFEESSTDAGVGSAKSGETTED